MNAAVDSRAGLRLINRDRAVWSTARVVRHVAFSSARWSTVQTGREPATASQSSQARSDRIGY